MYVHVCKKKYHILLEESELELIVIISNTFGNTFGKIGFEVRSKIFLNRTLYK